MFALYFCNSVTSMTVSLSVSLIYSYSYTMYIHIYNQKKVRDSGFPDRNNHFIGCISLKFETFVIIVRIVEPVRN